MRTFAILFPVLTAATLWGVPPVASAGNLSFLDSSPLVYFGKDDYEQMMKAVNEALESQELNAERQWRNPKTNSSGTVQVLTRFVATDGAECKRVRVANEAGGKKGKSTHILCKYEGRGWLLHPDAEPARPVAAPK